MLPMSSAMMKNQDLFVVLGLSKTILLVVPSRETVHRLIMFLHEVTIAAMPRNVEQLVLLFNVLFSEQHPFYELTVGNTKDRSR